MPQEATYMIVPAYIRNINCCLKMFYTHLGMLSKAKGQVLRVAAVLHVLFCDTYNEDGTLDLPASTISVDAILAAQNFVDVCVQQTAYIAGRRKISDEINAFTSEGIFTNKYIYILHENIYQPCRWLHGTYSYKIDLDACLLYVGFMFTKLNV